MLRRYALLLMTVCVSVSLAATDCTKCDCRHWPWKDDCDGCCSLKVFNNSSSKELRYFFQSDGMLAQPLADLRAKGPAASLDELQEKLGTQKFEKFGKGLKSMSPLEREYLISPPSQKMTIQKAPPPPSGL